MKQGAAELVFPPPPFSLGEALRWGTERERECAGRSVSVCLCVSGRAVRGCGGSRAADIRREKRDSEVGRGRCPLPFLTQDRPWEIVLSWSVFLISLCFPKSDNTVSYTDKGTGGRN